MPESTTPTPEGPQEVRRSFSESLEEIRDDVVKLTALTTEAIGTSTQALLDGDLTGAKRVIAEDSQIDERKESIELRVYEMFATQQPMAGDLRTLLAVLRILQEVQLTADLTVSIAKATRRLYPGQLAPKIRGLLERKGAQASVQLNLAVDAFADGDAAAAAALPDMDDVMDDLQKELFRAIFATCSNDEPGLQQAVQLALLGRYYERIADHAVLIGAWVRFMVTGELPSRAERQDSGTPV
ncbi:MAG: phosphate signaling complex protein PhoU [Acidimicrobiia bacterium]